jgi:hypothetical protein
MVRLFIADSLGGPHYQLTLWRSYFPRRIIVTWEDAARP